MELKRVEPLADTLSGLLRQSVRDVRKIEKMPGYGLAMNTWHTQDRSHNVCYVCMAGAVMACTLGAPQGASSELIFKELTPSESGRLYAVDRMRQGDLWSAYDMTFNGEPLTVETRAAIDAAALVIRHAFNGFRGHAPWEDYEKAAAILETAGL